MIGNRRDFLLVNKLNLSIILEHKASSDILSQIVLLRRILSTIFGLTEGIHLQWPKKE